MCKRLLIFLLVLGFASGAWAGPFGSDANCVMEWSFDNSYADTSGSGNTGDPCGTPAFTAQTLPGAGSHYLDLDGSSWVENLDPNNLPWAHPTWTARAGNATTSFLYKLTSPQDNDSYVAWGRYTTRQYRSVVDDYYGGTQRFRWYTGGSNPRYDCLTADGEWHMFTISIEVWDPNGESYTHAYHDGQLLASRWDTWYNAIAEGDRHIMAGNSLYTSNQVDGDLDEFTIWDYALSDAEVSDMYDAYFVIPEPATIALLSLGGLALLRRKR